MNGGSRFQESAMIPRTYGTSGGDRHQVEPSQCVARVQRAVSVAPSSRYCRRQYSKSPRAARVKALRQRDPTTGPPPPHPLLAPPDPKYVVPPLKCPPFWRFEVISGCNFYSFQNIPTSFLFFADFFRIAVDILPFYLYSFLYCKIARLIERLIMGQINVKGIDDVLLQKVKHLAVERRLSMKTIIMVGLRRFIAEPYCGEPVVVQVLGADIEKLREKVPPVKMIATAADAKASTVGLAKSVTSLHKPNCPCALCKGAKK